MSKKKHKSFHFVMPLGVYPFDVIVSIGQSDKELFKVFTKSNKPFDKEDFEAALYTGNTCQARAVMFSNNVSLLRLRKLPETAEDFGHVAHEIFHTVTFVMYKIGCILDIGKSDEAYAYLIQYITENFFSRTRSF